MAHSGYWQSPMRLLANELGPAKVIVPNHPSSCREFVNASHDLASRAIARRFRIARGLILHQVFPRARAIAIRLPNAKLVTVKTWTSNLQKNS